MNPRFYPRIILGFFMLFAIMLKAQIPSITPVDPKFQSDFIITTKLSGANEVPMVTTNAIGVATIHFNSDRTIATLNVTVSNLSSDFTGAHIHKAPVGSNGGVEINFTSNFNDGRITATFAVDAARIAELIKGELYLNIHTTNNPGGELRGQLTLEAPESFMGILSGDQENPAVTTNATGLVSVHYTANTNVLEINAQWDGLSGAATGVHLHQGEVGVNGGVVTNLTSSVVGNSIKVKVQAGDYIEALRAGNIYLNVHTAANANGEIRAQLLPQEGIIVDTWLTAAQEVPNNVTGGENSIGLGFFKIAPTLDIMNYLVQLNGLTGAPTAAHLHAGKLGISGGVKLGLTISGNQIVDNNVAITSSLLNDILTGELYINVHTATNGGGEVRGQLYRLARDGYTYDICPKQETLAPTDANDVSGSGMFAFNRDMDEAHLMVTVNKLSATFSGSHIHNAAAGSNGGVIFNFTDNFNNGGAFLYFTDISATPFNADFADKIRMANTYVNIHTTTNASGEVRGQIVKAISESCESCETDLVLSGNIKGLYRASNTIVTNGTSTTSNNFVALKAGKSIMLTNGFHAVSGIPFEAIIEDCSNNPANFNEVYPAEVRLATAKLSTGFKLFPNPALWETTVEYELTESQPVFLAIYNLTGQIVHVLHPQKNQAQGNHQVRVNLSDLKAGMYMVILQTNREVQSKKLLVGQRF